MNYARLFEVFKEEVEKERAIVDELSYKKGYKDGLDAVTDSVDINECHAEGYLLGLEDMLNAMLVIFDMNYINRKKYFNGNEMIKDIVVKTKPLDIMKAVCNYYTDQEEKEEDLGEVDIEEIVKVLKDANISDKLRNNLIDYIKKNKDLVILKIKK